MTDKIWDDRSGLELQYEALKNKYDILEEKYKFALDAIDRAKKASFPHTNSGSIIFEAHEKLKPKRERAL